MSEIHIEDQNPLSIIFKTGKNGEIIEEISSIKNIPSFFKYLTNEKILEEEKVNVIKKFKEIISKNRYILEYFSEYNNKSIYIFFFELFLSHTSSQDLKSAILFLLEEVILNIETTKNIYEYLYQKLSLLYRDENANQDSLNNLLMLLNCILGSTENSEKPRNYFCCSGNGKFEVDLRKDNIKMGKYLTFIINFKISETIETKFKQESQKIVDISNLIKINFSNGTSYTVELQNQQNLKLKEIKDSLITAYIPNEWINLVLCIYRKESKLDFYFFSNGENNFKRNQIVAKIKEDDTINSVEFFDNFYGEVSSMSMALTKEGSVWSLSNNFLKWFTNYKKGLWKKKYTDLFFTMLKELQPSIPPFVKNKSGYFKKHDINDTIIENGPKINYLNYFIFVFTPFNTLKELYGEVESSIGNIKLNYSGNIRNHKYQCYQKKLEFVDGINNLMPIAEMFLIRQKTLSEENLEIFLKIIINILTGRKLNIEAVKTNNFFQVLSLFIERYPKHLFTEKILENFVNLGKTIFPINDEALLSSYFEHIFLNEKILSKYSENLQIKFWQQILLFCQTDKEQISTFMNMNRICLILRFYDKNKYSEMCCERHLSEIKDKFIGNKTIMNPTMETKLSDLREIFQIVISAQNNANGIISLYKLLTLDLSPCLTKFILNIFSNSIIDPNCSIDLKISLKKQLIENEFELIAINTFNHSLPDVRFDLLKLMFEINTKLKIKMLSFQNMIKACLLPKEMFYATYKESKAYLDEIEKAEMEEEKKKKVEEQKTKKSHLRMSTFVSSKLIVNNLKEKKFGPKISKDEIDIDKIDEIIIKEVEEKEIIIEKNEKKENDEEDIDFKSNLKIDDNNNESNSNNENNFKENDSIKKSITSKNNYLSKSIAIITEEKKGADKDNLYEYSENQVNTNSNTNENIIKNNEEQQENTTDEKNKDEIIVESDEKEIIIKNELFEDYKKRLFDKFLLWSLGLNIDMELNIDNLLNVCIQYFDILEIVFVLNENIKDIKLTLKLIELIKILICQESNCYNMLINKKIYANILELTFKYLNCKDEIEQKISQIGRGILTAIFMNSFNYIKKSKLAKYPCYEIKTIFLWGKEIIKNNRYNNRNVLDFINSILKVLILELEKFDTKNECYKITSNIDSNFYLKNYLIFNTQIFGYLFHFKELYKDHEDINLKSNIISKYIEAMQLDLSKNRISDIWINYSFFNQLYKRFNYLWQKENIFKKYKVTIKKGNKLIKYENILQKLILDKNNKNIFLQELIFLTYENKNKQNYLVIPLINIITISLMCLISVLVKTGNNKTELLIWLKEFKKFIMFLIISSSNLTRMSQLELYIGIHEKIIGPLTASICFLKDILSKTKICKEKIEKTLHSIFLFCFIITKYEHQYIIKHKSGIKFFNLSTKLARNDLKNSAVYTLFNDMLKDKNGNTILPLSCLEKYDVNQYVNIIDLLDTNEWDEALYKNENLKKKLLKDFFTYSNFKNMENTFYAIIINENTYKNYSEEILYLLPLYEKELSKYSNNSLENTIMKKNRYKAIKKRAFSWNGLWSDRKLFFETPEKLKLKIINHYTKTLMKPLLSPILDIDYYLPDFTDFKKENLFKKNDNEENNQFKLIMDLDKILKSSEQNQISMNNIKEIFGGSKKKLRENYLRKIYLKSNPNLAESLQKISNNLDLGKEDTFIKLEHSENEFKHRSSIDFKKPKYVLACLVKASHHIKGVCFIDQNNLNFKVFLNQKTGNSMSGVELAFTNEDDDYDINRQTCFGSYFICHPKDKDLYQISINYQDMKWIFRRRYYYKNSGIEIFTKTNKSFYFNFKIEKDREYILNEIVKKIEDINIIYDDLKDPKDSFDNIIGFENGDIFKNKTKKKKVKISKIIEMWKNWEISNFELLMWLNIFSNRSYNDISQYPVFPWILGNYEDPLKTKQSISKKNKKQKKNKEENSININEGTTSESDEEEVDWDMIDGEIDYTYRDLSLPMGMLEINKEGIKRKELFMEMYETLKTDPDNESKPFLYGSNYSNPMYVCNFMMRLFPFSHISIELQGNKFDDPGRLFFAVKNSFFNSTSQKTDVRELIPEFFYLPELFLNINKLNLGKREDGIEVDNIITPCENNPFNFVMTMRNVLENEKISKSIQKWIDLIFGYKARGKEAELSNNIFSEKSYQENINISNEENKEALLRQVEFGLIPTQTLNKKCTKRSKKTSILKGKEIVDESAFLSYNKCRKLPENLMPKYSIYKKDKKDKGKLKENIKKVVLPIKKNNENASVLCIGCFSSEKLSLFYNDNTFQERKISCPVFDKVFTDEILTKTKLKEQYNKMSGFYSNEAINRKAITFSKNGKIIILGGFFDGGVALMSTDGKENKILEPFKDESPVLCVVSDNDDEYIFMGNAIGNVCIYKNIEGKYKNSILLTDQKTAISHIFYSPELNMLATASVDGYICIYTLPLCKLIRCLKVPTNFCSYVMLSDSPLPVIIAICQGNGENNEIYVYSINGNLFLKKEECFMISNPLLYKSINSTDYLVCIGDENIYIFSLPDLIMQITVEKEFNANSMCFSEDKKILYVANKNGAEIMVIKTEKEKNILSRSITVLRK